MYVKRHKVRKGGRSYVYLRLVEAYRDEAGKVRHRQVATLGREDQLKASGQLEQLAASFARLDPPAAGTRRVAGPLLLVAHYLDRLGLVKLVDALVPVRGRALLTHGEVIAVLAASRLCSPSPLYDIAGWASSAAVGELLGVPAMLLNDDRLGRALEALAPVAEKVRGELMLAALGGFPAITDASRLHLDLTAVRFAGAYEDSALVAKGWAADRSIARQVKALQAATPAGVSVYFRPHKGSASELAAFTAAIETLASALPPGLVIVADSGLGYAENLCAADAANVKFVAPLRADTGWAARFDADVGPLGGLAALATLDYVSYRERRLPPARRTTWKGLLRPFPSPARTAPATTCAPPTSGPPKKPPPSPPPATAPWPRPKQPWPASATGSAAATTKPGSRSTPASPRSSPARPPACSPSAPAPGPASPSSPGRATRTRSPPPPASTGCTRSPPTCPTTRGQSPLTAADVLKTYKDQWIVEQRHRDLKHTLKVRPIFLHNDDRIAALVAVIGIALLIFGLIEAELRAALGPGTPLPGILPEGRAAIPTARAALTAFDGLCATYTPDGGLILDRLTPAQRMILACLDIPLPWPEKL